MTGTEKLTPLQMELLKTYSFSPTEKELRDIKAMLGRYFGTRLARKASAAADRMGITDSDLDDWLKDGST